MTAALGVLAVVTARKRTTREPTTSASSDARLVPSGSSSASMADVQGTGDVVRRYFGLVADLRSTVEDLLAVLHPDIRVVEHPNRLSPAGNVRDRDAVIAGFLAGKRLLAAQRIDIHELISAGDRVVVRATWHGTVADGSSTFGPGTDLVTHMAAFITVEQDRVREHESFDCVAPPRPVA